MEHHKAAFGLAPEKACDVGVGQGTCHYLLPLSQQLDGLDAVPDLSGLFKAQLLGSLLHLGGEVRLDLLKFPLQQGHCLGDGLVVALFCHLPAAVAVALSHMEVEAGALLADVPRELPAAGGQAQSRTQGIHDLLGTVAAGVGTKVPCPILCHPVGQRKAGILLF